jgi:hypothetical protein
MNKEITPLNNSNRIAVNYSTKLPVTDLNEGPLGGPYSNLHRYKFIHFHNDTDLPIMMDSWVDGSNHLYCRKIDPRQKLVVHSSVGEWHLNAMFRELEDRKLWNENGFEKKILVGKFRSKPCASGNYSWMEYDEPFECTYSKVEITDENKIGGLITFSIKK